MAEGALHVCFIQHVSKLRFIWILLFLQCVVTTYLHCRGGATRHARGGRRRLRGRHNGCQFPVLLGQGVIHPSGDITDISNSAAVKILEKLVTTGQLAEQR